jgi:NAD(P)-dependent dehydrogenase (short-subunit alcohol dehydrogenase family)
VGSYGTEVVVVTGATAGVGRAVAQRLARDGVKIGLLARGNEGLDGAAREVEQLGGKALAVPTDVADPEQVEVAARAVEEAFGPIDVWVNNAMTSVFAKVKDIEPDEFKRVTDVTYLGVVYGSLAALRRMLPRDRGVIIQVGSALAYRSIPLQAAYCASKHAVQGFTDSLRTELLHDRSNVRVTAVHLPAMNTPQFDQVASKLPKKARPVPPIYQPEVAAGVIRWAAHHRRREVWVGGTTVATIMANRLFPGLLDRYLARTGFESQQTDEPEDPNRPDNLWKPVPGDPGAHGRFDRQARPRSFQVWATEHRPWLTAGAAMAAAVAGGRLVRTLGSPRSGFRSSP